MGAVRVFATLHVHFLTLMSEAVAAMFDAAGVVTGPGGRAAAEDEIRTRTRSDEATNVEPNEKGGRCALFCRQRAAPSQD